LLTWRSTIIRGTAFLEDRSQKPPLQRGSAVNVKSGFASFIYGMISSISRTNALCDDRRSGSREAMTNHFGPIDNLRPSRSWVDNWMMPLVPVTHATISNLIPPTPEAISSSC
jgi:hypothetical protein